MTLLFTEPQSLCFHSLWSAVSHRNYLQLPAESVGALSSTNTLQKGGKNITVAQKVAIGCHSNQGLLNKICRTNWSQTSSGLSWVLAPARGSGKLREAVLAQMVNVRLSSDWTRVIAGEGGC